MTQRIFCSQCGQPWHYPACGPTHAIVAAKQEQRETDTYLPDDCDVPGCPKCAANAPTPTPASGRRETLGPLQALVDRSLRAHDPHGDFVTSIEVAKDALTRAAEMCREKAAAMREKENAYSMKPNRGWEQQEAGTAAEAHEADASAIEAFRDGRE